MYEEKITSFGWLKYVGVICILLAILIPTLVYYCQEDDDKIAAVEKTAPGKISSEPIKQQTE